MPKQLTTTTITAVSIIFLFEIYFCLRENKRSEGQRVIKIGCSLYRYDITRRVELQMQLQQVDI